MTTLCRCGRSVPDLLIAETAWNLLNMGATDVVSVWGGARGTIVLKSDGTVWTWGANGFGKLGIGDTNIVRMDVPVEVHGEGNASFLNSVKAIMGGETHNIALKADGTIWAWGMNAFGQLGNGTTNDSWTPVQTGLAATPPLTSVVKLGGRPYFTLAVKSDGTVWAWGMNRYGQVGNGTVNPLSGPQVTVPVLVTNSQTGGPISSPLQVTCGYQFGAALTRMVRSGPGAVEAMENWARAPQRAPIITPPRCRV